MTMLALTAPPLSGKTTLARYLEHHYGFVFADHSLTLVREYVAWHNSMGWRLSTKEVYDNKEAYRKSLQEFGYQIGFNGEHQSVWWAEKTLSEWRKYPVGTSIVFDSVRDVYLADYLSDLGFKLVRIVIGGALRRQRAESLGRDYADIEQSVLARSDLERASFPVDITLFGHLPLEQQAHSLAVQFALGEYH